MEFKLNKIDQVKNEVEFDVPNEELKPHFEKAYEKFKKKVQIPGFRKGKAPTSMVKKMYGQAIEYEALEEISESFYKQYLTDNNIETVGTGRLTDMNYEPDGNLKFKVEYEVKPDFELKDYKGMQLSKTKFEVTDALVEDELRYQLIKNSTHEETDKAENEEHIVTLDIQKLDDTMHEIIGEHQKDLRVFLNDKEINPDLKEQLIGIGLNETRFLKLKQKNPDSGVEELENYRAEAVKVEKMVYPEKNEEFFKKVSGKDDIKDEEGFRNWIRERLEDIYKNISENELKNNIVNEMIKMNDIQVPETFVENIIHSQIDEIKNRSPKRELPPDFNEEEFHKSRRVDAVIQAKWFLIREKLLEVEKIEVSDEDIEPLVKLDAERYGIPEEKLREIYKQNPDVKYKILDDKVMKFLMDNAEIKEIENKDKEIIS